MIKEFYEIDLIKAHEHSKNNYHEIMNGYHFACFYCFDVIETKEILTFNDSNGNDHVYENTVICPCCGIDATIGQRSGYDIFDIDFIEAMGLYWFNGYAKGHKHTYRYETLLNHLKKRFIIHH